jgi:hypothetical protein
MEREKRKQAGKWIEVGAGNPTPVWVLHIIAWLSPRI